MTKIAYSYLRFSTIEQAASDSRRRQHAMAEQYVADHHLKLDRQLSFRDLGVSAFRGRNAKEGALRAFLEAIEHNLVPDGSILLIEFIGPSQPRSHSLRPGTIHADHPSGRHHCHTCRSAFLFAGQHQSKSPRFDHIAGQHDAGKRGSPR